MEKLQNKFLIIVLFCLSFSIYSSDFFEGIWRSHNTKDEKMDSFIGIEKVSNEEYFVIYVDPFNEHKLDFATYGSLDKAGYLVVDLGGDVYYLEKYDDISFYLNWNFKKDMNANRFTRVKGSSLKDMENPYVDFNKYIESTVEDNK